MTESKIITIKKPEEILKDPLTEMLQNGARKLIAAMVYKLGQSAQQRWRKLRGFKYLAEIIKGVQFKNGEPITPQEDDEANRIAMGS